MSSHLQEELKNAFTKNKQLASDYEGLRKTLLEAREDAVIALTNKNHTDETYHYYTKVRLKMWLNTVSRCSFSAVIVSWLVLFTIVAFSHDLFFVLLYMEKLKHFVPSEEVSAAI